MAGSNYNNNINNHMYRQPLRRPAPLRFKHFTRKGYALFSCLGKEVLICTLSIPTLTYAKADGISTHTEKADTARTAVEKTVLLDDVEVTASKAPTLPGQTARIVHVLSRDAIAAAPVQSINDLLKYAAGVDVRQRGPIGVQTDVSVRGGNSEQVAILLNGINIGDPQTAYNAFDFPCDIDDIDHIEVLEGPAARVYGTSSLVGAVNIVTTTAARSSISAHIDAGSYGYASAGARLALAGPTWKNAVSGSYTRSDGYSRCKAGTLNADYHGGKAFYQGGYEDQTITAKWHAGISAKDFGANTFYGAKWDDQYEHTLKTYTALSVENKNGRFHLRPSIYWNRNMDRYELFRNAEDKYPFNYHRTDIYGLNLNSYFDWTLGRTALGAEIRNEDLVSTVLGEPLDHPSHVHGTSRDYQYGLNRTNISFILEHNISVGRFTASAGMIAAKNSWNHMNMRVYPGADLSFAISSGLRIYASYNTSLRMPSATELYYSVGGHKADKYLKPEEMASVEGGLKYVTNGIRAKASIYYNHCSNLIDWVRDTSDDENAVWKSVNFTKVNATGVELSATIDWRALFPGQRWCKSLNVAYSHIHQNKVETEGLQSRYTLEYLRHKLVADLQTTIVPGLDFGLYYRWQERTGYYTDVNGTDHTYRPYSIVDARLTWTKPRYRCYVEVNNLLDKTYVDYGNVPQPGIWIMGGASVNINL